MPLKDVEYRRKYARQYYLIHKSERVSYFKEYNRKNAEIIKIKKARKLQSNSLNISVQRKIYRQINNDIYKNRDREYYWKNKNRISEVKKSYYQRNKDLIKKKSKEYYERNKIRK